MDPALLKFRPAPFALALVCFVMPFLTLACPGGGVTLSGLEVAFGTTVQGQSLEGQPLAVAALVLAVVGLFLSLKPVRDAMMGAVASGGLGAVLLLVLQSKLQSETARQGPVQLSFEFGFWCALLALAAGAGLNAVALNTGQPMVAPEPSLGKPLPTVEVAPEP